MANGTHRRNQTMIPMSSVPRPATTEVGARQAPAKSATERPRKPTRAKTSTLDRDKDNRADCQGRAGRPRGCEKAGLTIGSRGLAAPSQGKDFVGSAVSCYTADGRRTARIRQWSYSWAAT